MLVPTSYWELSSDFFLLHWRSQEPEGTCLFCGCMVHELSNTRVPKIGKALGIYALWATSSPPANESAIIHKAKPFTLGIQKSCCLGFGNSVRWRHSPAKDILYANPTMFYILCSMKLKKPAWTLPLQFFLFIIPSSCSFSSSPGFP